jgi:hypothetical protein
LFQSGLALDGFLMHLSPIPDFPAQDGPFNLVRAIRKTWGQNRGRARR